MARRFIDLVDRLNERVGSLVSWLLLAMVLVGAFNAIVRYLGRFTGWNLSSNAYLEAQWYLFSCSFLLAGAYALKRNSHVRVDVLYARMSPRTQLWIDLLGSLFFLIPFSVFALAVSWGTIRNSWAVREVSSDPGGLPRYPIKSVILVAFALLLLQGLAEVLRRIVALRDRETLESSSAEEVHHGG